MDEVMAWKSGYFLISQQSGPSWRKLPAVTGWVFYQGDGNPELLKLNMQNLSRDIPLPQLLDALQNASGE